MILKASQRSGGRKLGYHLLNANDNEHVEVAEIRGFMSDNLLGAFNEARAISLGTKCKQYLFSLSMNPPETENVRKDVFEKAIETIEQRLGLTGQPRAVVFHEKEGRRHCHVVWSRIDAEMMKAKQLSFFKDILQKIGKDLFIENGWKLPSGYLKGREKNPFNFTLSEWQQAKRHGYDPQKLKEAVQECYAATTNAKEFGEALEAHGLFLAQGDRGERRAHVVVNAHGGVSAVSRLVGSKRKEVAAKLGSPDTLPTVKKTSEKIAALLTPKFEEFIAEAREIAATQLKPLHDERIEMTNRHREDRRLLTEKLLERQDAETRERAARVPKGILGIWHRITGKYAKIRAQNELETTFAQQRDRAETDAVVNAQLLERSELQLRIEAVRDRHQHQMTELYNEVTALSEASQTVEHAMPTQHANQGQGFSLGLG